MYLGRLGDARTLYARAVAQARTSSSAGQLAPMLDRLAYIELLLGRLPGRRDARARRAAAGRRPRLSTPAWLCRAWRPLHAYRGEEAECRAQARLAMEVGATRQLRMISAAAQWALGLLELGAGRPAEALAALESVASSTDGHPGILRWATPDLVEAAARSGRPEASAPAVARLQAWAEASGLPDPGRGPGQVSRAARVRRGGGRSLRGRPARRRPGHPPARAGPDPAAARRDAASLPPARGVPRRTCAAPWRPSSDCGADPWADRARSELRAIRREHHPTRPCGARAPHPPGAPDRAVRRRRRQQRRDRRQAVPQPPDGRVPPRQGLHEDRRLVPSPARRGRPPPVVTSLCRDGSSSSNPLRTAGTSASGANLHDEVGTAVSIGRS